MIRFIKGSIAATTGLLLAVMLVQWALQLTTGHRASTTGNLSGNTLLWGLLADTIRGCLLAYLYPQMKNAGTSYLHAIRFGMAASLLVATLWVVYQYGVSIAPDIGWLFEESIVIVLQGILSGIGLG